MMLVFLCQLAWPCAASHAALGQERGSGRTVDASPPACSGWAEGSPLFGGASGVSGSPKGGELAARPTQVQPCLHPNPACGLEPGALFTLSESSPAGPLWLCPAQAPAGGHLVGLQRNEQCRPPPSGSWFLSLVLPSQISPVVTALSSAGYVASVPFSVACSNWRCLSPPACGHPEPCWMGSFSS